jgi:uncharacterized protein (DUF433 family)
MVSIVIEMLRDKATIREILEAYPSLSEEHIAAALQFAAGLVAKRFKLASV